MSMNPWNVQSIHDFNFFCCPECVYRSKEEFAFQAHALQNHSLSTTFFHGVENAEENHEHQGSLLKGYCQLFWFSIIIFLCLKSKYEKGYQKSCPCKNKITKMQKHLVKLSYLALFLSL